MGSSELLYFSNVNPLITRNRQMAGRSKIEDLKTHSHHKFEIFFAFGNAMHKIEVNDLKISPNGPEIESGVSGKKSTLL